MLTAPAAFLLLAAAVAADGKEDVVKLNPHKINTIVPEVKVPEGFEFATSMVLSFSADIDARPYSPGFLASGKPGSKGVVVWFGVYVDWAKKQHTYVRQVFTVEVALDEAKE